MSLKVLLQSQMSRQAERERESGREKGGREGYSELINQYWYARQLLLFVYVSLLQSHLR
jgi:hypothetical protein